MYCHYVNEPVVRGLLEDVEEVAKSGPTRQVRITAVGRLPLRAIDRDTPAQY